jgi:hypothetical protein
VVLVVVTLGALLAGCVSAPGQEVEEESSAPAPQPEVVDGAEELLDARLAELGDYTLEAIEVEPFTTKVEGVTFGWVATEYDGMYALHVEPGDFIAYYAPWDGLEYDT